MNELNYEESEKLCSLLEHENHSTYEGATRLIDIASIYALLMPELTADDMVQCLYWGQVMMNHLDGMANKLYMFGEMAKTRGGVYRQAFIEYANSCRDYFVEQFNTEKKSREER